MDENKFLYRSMKRERYSRNSETWDKTYEKLQKKTKEFHYIKDSEISDFKKVGGKISKSERRIIYADENSRGMGYIGTPHSFAINRYLRDRSELPSEYQKVVATLDGVIEKNRALKNIKVNRFDDDGYFEAILKNNRGVLKKYESIEAALNSGEATFSNDGYTSTSYIPKYNFFKDRSIKTIINIPKNSEIYFTDNDIESEIIIPRGSKYDIISMRRKGDNVIIEMNLKEE